MVQKSITDNDGFPSDTYSYLSKMDRSIISCTSCILQQYIPIITLHTYDLYNDRIQDSLAEAAALAMYKNNKASELYNDVNTLISAEQSVNAPTVDNMIDIKVNSKIKTMSDR